MLKYLLAVVLVLIFVLVLARVIAYLLWDEDYRRDSDFPHFAIRVLLIILLVMNIGVFVLRCFQGINVYRGNTNLQVTYQDGQPIDSVVVLKNK